MFLLWPTVSELWISNLKPNYVYTVNILIEIKKTEGSAEKNWRPHFGDPSWIPISLYFLPQNLFHVKIPLLLLKRIIPKTSSSEVGWGVL